MKAENPKRFVPGIALERARLCSPIVNATIEVFSSGKSIIFRNESERFEIDDFGILSLARPPIPPHRRHRDVYQRG